MNFTREPIIETVITPREGCKLVVRSSKANGQEDYFVDAVEVVSFGRSFFFRSQERPKSFLLPVSDYEILELKETRMVLKNVSADRNIKIGGGREAPRSHQPHQPPQQQPSQEQPLDETLAESRPAPTADRNLDRKRGQRRRGRRGRDRGPDNQPRPEQQQPRHEEPMAEQSQQEGEEPKAAPSFISKLFPPPPTLIKETLSRYKPMETADEASLHHEEKMEETIFEHSDTPEPKTEDDDFEE